MFLSHIISFGSNLISLFESNFQKNWIKVRVSVKLGYAKQSVVCTEDTKNWMERLKWKSLNNDIRHVQTCIFILTALYPFLQPRTNALSVFNGEICSHSIEDQAQYTWMMHQPSADICICYKVLQYSIHTKL